jgi:hypothetical protein
MGISGGVVTVVFFPVWGQVYGRSHLGKIQSCTDDDSTPNSLTSFFPKEHYYMKRLILTTLFVAALANAGILHTNPMDVAKGTCPRVPELKGF